MLGGGGFIGTNLCRRLAASGWSVRAFGRRCISAAAIEGIDWRQGNFDDSEALARAVADCDVIFHLISSTPQRADLDMPADANANVVPTLALCEMVEKLGARIVFVSSGGTVYGRSAQTPTPEFAPTNPISAYGASKLAIEKYLQVSGHRHGLDYRILRVSNAFGPFQLADKKQGFVGALIQRVLKGEAVEIWGDGSVVRDYVYVDDVVDALLLAAKDEGKERLFNIGSGDGRDLRDVISVAERALGQTIAVDWREGRPLDVPVSVLAIDRAREYLGWSPRVTFDEGMERTIAWWKQARAEL